MYWLTLWWNIDNEHQQHCHQAMCWKTVSFKEAPIIWPCYHLHSSQINPGLLKTGLNVQLIIVHFEQLLCVWRLLLNWTRHTSSQLYITNGWSKEGWWQPQCHSVSCKPLNDKQFIPRSDFCSQKGPLEQARNIKAAATCMQIVYDLSDGWLSK